MTAAYHRRVAADAAQPLDHRGGPTKNARHAFYFQCTRPDALDCGDFAAGRSQDDNVRAVIRDVLGHGNESCMLPGEPEARSKALSIKHGGLLFTAAEVDAFAALATEAKHPFAKEKLPSIDV
jgi:ureidoglycolate dehydrogenase (NAD+)